LLVLFSPLLLFFSCYYYSSHMVLVFSCDEVIKLLKLILINGNFNNQVVKTSCYCICENCLIWKPNVKTSCYCIWKTHPIWKLGEFLKIKNLITQLVLINPKIYIYIYKRIDQVLITSWEN
jgi:hypothetical protein